MAVLLVRSNCSRNEDLNFTAVEVTNPDGEF